MDIVSIIKSANPDFVIFLFTTLIAFFSWVVRSFLKPIIDSKATFDKFFEKRIEILTEVKSRLSFIAYFPMGRESFKYKNQLQDLMLKDGRTCYLNKVIFDAVLKISIDPHTDEKLLMETVNEINKDLELMISKVAEEISFYRKFSNYSPLKRFVGYISLLLGYGLSITLCLTVISTVIFFYFKQGYLVKIIVILVLFGILYLINKWLRK